MRPPAEDDLVSTLEKFIPFVKYQGRRAQSILEKHPEDENLHKTLPGIVKQFRDTAEAMQNAAVELQQLREENERLKKQLSQRQNAFKHNVTLTGQDIRDIPSELLSQLNISESDQKEFQLHDIIEEAGGVMSMDKLLVAYYRATGEVLERSKLNQRLYRMTQKGLLFSVPSRKGVYATYQVNEPSELDAGEG